VHLVLLIVLVIVIERPGAGDRSGSAAATLRGTCSGSAIALSTPVRYAKGILEMALAIPLV
jgi:hypothetical protein